MLMLHLVLWSAVAAAGGRKLSDSTKQLPDHWRKLAAYRYMSFVNTSRLDQLQAELSEKLKVQVRVLSENIQVLLDQRVVYTCAGNESEGFHVIAVHPWSGRVMLHRQFLTGQLAEGELLASCLASLQPRTVVVIIALFNAGDELGRTERFLLEMLGMEGHGAGGAVRLAYDFSQDINGSVKTISSDDFLRLQKNARSSSFRKTQVEKEKRVASDNIYSKTLDVNSTHWSTATPEEKGITVDESVLVWDGYLQSADPAVLISRVPQGWPPQHQQDNLKGHVYAETANVCKDYRKVTGNLEVTAIVPRIKEHACGWHEDSSRAAQRRFCSQYEGYGALCRCEEPIDPSTFRSSTDNITIVETIPVAMLTATKSYFFYRQLVNLLSTAGAAQTPILVLIDGHHRETAQLASLFGLPVLVHDHEGAAGSNVPVNEHLRFSLHAIFETFPKASKAIILEDDLLLSPDFLSFFQQSSWLLDADPSIYVINSFSVNSCSLTAGDPTKLIRTESFPEYGWMVSRTVAEDFLNHWVDDTSPDYADWDWWLHSPPRSKGRNALSPEVSRSLHAGSAGTHITGWMQGMVYSYMIYNQDPHAKLQNLELLQKDLYEAHMLAELQSATRLPPSFVPCDLSTLPQNLPPGPVLVSVFMETSGDRNKTMRFMARCLHAFPYDVRNQYNGVLLFPLTGVMPHRTLYVVGCPFSNYCNYLIPLPIVGLPLPDIERSEQQDNLWRMRRALRTERRLRFFNHTALSY